MIVLQVHDPSLRKAAMRAAHPEEDVVAESRLALGALEHGFPRLLVREESRRHQGWVGDVPILEVDHTMRRRWEAARLSDELPLTRLDYLTSRLRYEFSLAAAPTSWADRALAELSRVAGARLPVSLRSFGRRVMEFPLH